MHFVSDSEATEARGFVKYAHFLKEFKEKNMFVKLLIKLDFHILFTCITVERGSSNYNLIVLMKHLVTKPPRKSKLHSELGTALI